MASRWPVKTIGPTIPSIYLDKRLEDDKEYGLNLFKPNVDACMKWLDTKEIGSVVFASFGSLAALGEEQMEELSLGLKNSNCYFLWVVRESEEKKLPDNFLEETTEKGLVVTWCPQLDVLAHKAIGCFMTHCGWNSTLEALSLGVPMVAMPQWTDQPTNAKFIADVWKVGIRIKLNEKGIATREEIELCIREVMEGERGKEMKKNSLRWKELAIEAVDEGGSSDKNIEEFVAKLAHSY
jgi:pathogen-inducible salicylic acid glucosyltransferase